MKTSRFLLLLITVLALSHTAHAWVSLAPMRHPAVRYSDPFNALDNFFGGISRYDPFDEYERAIAAEEAAALARSQRAKALRAQVERMEEARAQMLLNTVSSEMSTNNDETSIKMWTPGTEWDDFSVQLQGTTLTIKCLANGKVHAERQFSVPVNSDMTNVQATFDEGVLRINIPRVTPKALPIPVKKALPHLSAAIHHAPPKIEMGPAPAPPAPTIEEKVPAHPHLQCEGTPEHKPPTEPEPEFMVTEEPYDDPVPSLDES